MRYLLVVLVWLSFSSTSSALWCTQYNVWHPDCFATQNECVLRRMEIVALAAQRGSGLDVPSCTNHVVVWEMYMIHGQPSTDPTRPHATLQGIADIDVSYLRAYSREACQTAFERNEAVTLWGLPTRVVSSCYPTSVPAVFGDGHIPAHDRQAQREAHWVNQCVNSFTEPVTTHQVRHEAITRCMRHLAVQSSNLVYIAGRADHCWAMLDVRSAMEDASVNVERARRRSPVYFWAAIAGQIAQDLDDSELRQAISAIPSRPNSRMLRRLTQTVEAHVRRMGGDFAQEAALVLDDMRHAEASRLLFNSLNMCARPQDPTGWGGVLDNISSTRN